MKNNIKNIRCQKNLSLCKVNEQVIIVLCSGFWYNILNVDIIASTKSTITVKWGNTSKKFNRETGLELPYKDEWCTWRLHPNYIIDVNHPNYIMLSNLIA